MPAKDLGTKHTCFKCQTRFYDLKKSEPICPKCGADQRQSPANKPSAAEKRRAPPKAAAAPALPVADPEVDDVEAEVDEDEDDVEDDEEDDEP
jgi:predicted  nucleic acid-binding Zn-ribbon protein